MKRIEENQGFSCGIYRRVAFGAGFGRRSGGRFLEEVWHSCEVRPGSWAWKGAGVVQMVWMGVEKEENGVESDTKARPYERIGRKMRTMVEREEPMPDPDLIAALFKLLATLPGIAEEKTATHATFLTG